MDRQNKVNNFVIVLEALSSSVISKSFKVSENYLSDLENNIISYIRTNYPAVIFTKEDLKAEIEPVYQDRHLKLKQQIDKNVGLMKYNLDAENADVNQIIEEEVNKYKTLFASISAGTNINYLGLVDECTQNVMRLLIRKNSSISFAKRTEDVNKHIYSMVNNNFFTIMVNLGNYFINNEINPIEENFKLDDMVKSKTKMEEFF